MLDNEILHCTGFMPPTIYALLSMNMLHKYIYIYIVLYNKPQFHKNI